MMFRRVFQTFFGLWLLAMFIMTLLGWKPPESILSEAGVRWAEVNLRPDMMTALALMFGIGAITFLSDRFVAFGAAILAPLAVNIAMYHMFVNQVLMPGGFIAIAFCLCVAAMLWLNRASYAMLFKSKPRA